ncbi:MAG: phospholipase [Deltaproteobacteria bacterium]|nr:phospholipase [Deltaproteobacteria bacterium]
MSHDFEVTGGNTAAAFTLKLHRGDGMTLIAMNWKKKRPPRDFVGFAIEYQEPDGDRFYALTNRLTFPGIKRTKANLSTLRSPIQKFRWVHFPRNAELPGPFTYRVTPVFMNSLGELSYGEAQTAQIELARETYAGKVNVTFTRGFVSSQAFVERYESAGPISTLLPAKADDGLSFQPTHPKADEALEWMGFEARSAILELLDEAIVDKHSKVYVVAYDLNEPEIVSRLLKLKKRLSIIIDDSGTHGPAHSAESVAAGQLGASPGAADVTRQHVGQLQHNKFIVVDGPKTKAAICGSTNFSWRGLYVQGNNALVVRGAKAIQPFLYAFDAYRNDDSPAVFGGTSASNWTDLGITGVDAKVAFSPHTSSNALLAKIAKDIETKTKSSLFYSLAFLYQTPGAMQDAIRSVMQDDDKFVYGISDKKVGGIEVQTPDGNVTPVFAAALGKNAPEPFHSEPKGGGGTRMHHKFVVIDFDRPTARVYLGSYNFSVTADTKNGENLVLIKDRRIATSYMIEALRIFDHYHFRVAQQAAKAAKEKLELAPAPSAAGEEPWWQPYYTDARRIRDRILFA